MAPFKLSSFPAASNAQLVPSRALYIHAGSARTISIINVTQHLGDLASLVSEETSTPDLNSVKTVASNESPVLELHRGPWFAPTLTAKDLSGTIIAEASAPLVALGRWSITLGEGSPHGAHEINLKPAGFGRRADVFVQNSIPFYWDAVDGGGRWELYRAENGEKREVARFVGKHTRDRSGLLLLDEGGIDWVVASLTCVAVLNRSDSFRL